MAEASAVDAWRKNFAVPGVFFGNSSPGDRGKVQYNQRCHAVFDSCFWSKMQQALDGCFQLLLLYQTTGQEKLVL